MKRTYRVQVDVKLETVTVVVEAENDGEALELGEERAKEAIEKSLPDTRKGRARYVAVDAMEMTPPATWNA